MTDESEVTLTVGNCISYVSTSPIHLGGFVATDTASQRLDLLRSAPLNAWIALSEDESRIVATGASYQEVAEGSEKAGEPNPIIIKTPVRWLAFSV